MYFFGELWPQRKSRQQLSALKPFLFLKLKKLQNILLKVVCLNGLFTSFQLVSGVPKTI